MITRFPVSRNYVPKQHHTISHSNIENIKQQKIKQYSCLCFYNFMSLPYILHVIIVDYFIMMFTNTLLILQSDCDP